ncbi:hypothetical protein [Nocardia bovistercoris]|uniref:Uncharacterized protein n=1 Tax=Nocardia bovistercoris TaxID=2785916 RepID=A0A931IB78_9NOCA|nr:hypothetical protein [Nocardia bovistercoris]MBH0776628.1 hypothetical protein [Nocardia bovistercoris]
MAMVRISAVFMDAADLRTLGDQAVECGDHVFDSEDTVDSEPADLGSPLRPQP